jgi:DNA polymerase III subunit epsilon
MRPFQNVSKTGSPLLVNQSVETSNPLGCTPNDPDPSDAFERSLIQVAQALEVTGDFKVLRRLRAHDTFMQLPGDRPTKTAVIVDCETTGLDTRHDEIIELALIRFTFTTDGRVGRILETFNAFNEPTKSITKTITEITGITNEMVAGQHIDPAAVASFISDAQLVVAHNAQFDRQCVERYFSEFQHVGWACSLQVDWRAYGFDGTRLTQLLGHIGLFHDAHRGLDDCRALLELLAFELPGVGKTILSILLDQARRRTVRVWAEGAPYHLKDELKRRRYRWSDGSDGSLRCWFVDVDEDCYRDEIEYLRRHIVQRGDVEFHVQRLDAFNRFSNRI